MIAGLLLRGIVAGLLAGLLAASFAAVVSEPSIERALEFERSAARAAGEQAEPELVSRGVQKSAGLLTAGMIHGGALGGLFALAVAFAYGRAGTSDLRALSALLAGAGFVAIAFVPALKYPADPPAIGGPETIGARTSLYLAMVLVSLLAAVTATVLRSRLARSLGTWNASIAGLVAFIAIAGGAAILFPSANAIPAGFPAEVLWEFRVAALATQVILWSALGFGFAIVIAALPVRGLVGRRRVPH